MSKWKYVLILLAVAIFFISGCKEKTPEKAENEAMENLGFPDVYYDVSQKSGDIPIDDLELATSVPPYFSILDGYLFHCQGQSYIVTQVFNWSGWSFQYISQGASTDIDQWVVWPKDWWPFHHGGLECPLAPPFTHLGPGEQAFLYLPVEHTYGHNQYHVWINMCTFVGDPPSYAEHCVLKTYELTVEEVPFREIHIPVLQEWPCLKGPTPAFDNIGNLFPGDIVQLLALGDVEGMLIVLHPKYGQACWAPEDIFDIPDKMILTNLETKTSSGLPSDCPKGTEWDPKTETCVEKEKKTCADYTDPTSCTAAGCAWTRAGNCIP